MLTGAHCMSVCHTGTPFSVRACLLYLCFLKENDPLGCSLLEGNSAEDPCPICLIDLSVSSHIDDAGLPGPAGVESRIFARTSL